MQPSLNDSLLVKQGLVEETTLPQPTHSAYDIQVCFAVWRVIKVTQTRGLMTGITVSDWAESTQVQHIGGCAHFFLEGMRDDRRYKG